MFREAYLYFGGIWGGQLQVSVPINLSSEVYD